MSPLNTPARPGDPTSDPALGPAVEPPVEPAVEPPVGPSLDPSVEPAAATGPRAVPEATVARLSVYLRALNALAEDATATVSSDTLAALAGVNGGLLRKDLSHLGSYGIRGVGYHVSTLVEQISSTLGLTEDRAVALVGVGNLGQALAGYGGFGSRGFRIAALLDIDPSRVGRSVHGVVVRHLDELDDVVRREHISIAVLATPAAAAQQVCNRLVAAGITSVLNFAPVVLAVPAHVDVRKVDLAGELQILSFHEHRKSGSTGAMRTLDVGVSQ